MQQIIADEVEKYLDISLTNSGKKWLSGQEPEPHEVEIFLPRELWQEIERRYTEQGWLVQITETHIKLTPANGN